MKSDAQGKRRPPEDDSLLPVPEALEIILDSDSSRSQFDFLRAAWTLLFACDEDLSITIEDLLRCLDHGGSIATVGARCLYVRTGRDGLGWTTGTTMDGIFVVDRKDWENYLHNHPEKAEPGGAPNS